MKWSYACPHCNVMLNPAETIVLLAEHDGERLLVGFHPQPGNYRMYLPPGWDAPAGERWDLFCPSCHESLTSELSDDLCAIDTRFGSDTHRVYFSRVVCEQATFVVSAEGLLQDHGIHTDRYLEQMIHKKYMG